MDRVTPALVEQAAELVLRRVEPANQNELLTVLGIFAEDVMTPENLDRLVSRERVMSSTFIRRVFQEELAEIEAATERREAEMRQREAEARQREDEARQREAVLEAALLEREAAVIDRLRRTVEDTVAIRFPATAIGHVSALRGVSDPDVLQDLNRALLRAADQAEAERILAQIGEQAAR